MTEHWPVDVLLVLGASSGGIGTHVLSVASELADRRRVSVAAPMSTQRRFDFAGAGASVVSVPAGLRMLTAPRRVRRLLRSASVVHAHGLQAGVAVGLLALGLPTRVVMTWHNAPLDKGVRALPHRLLERLAARLADVTLGASDDLVARARAAGARDARFLPVAPLPLPAPSDDRVALRRRLGLGDDLVVLTIGRLHRQKRLDLLLSAAPRWAATVLVAGDGPEREALQRKASALSNVRLLGRRDDVADLLCAADVVVLPSDWEARPLVAQEALQGGRALVATAVGGVPGLVGDAAVLVPAGDVDALADAVDRLLRDPAERARLERAAVARAGCWPDGAEVALRLATVYDEVGPA